MNNEKMLKEIYDKIITEKLSCRDAANLLVDMKQCTLYSIMKKYTKKHSLPRAFTRPVGKQRKELIWK